MEFPDLGAHCSWPACQRLGERRGARGVGTARTPVTRPRSWAWAARSGQPGLRGGGGAAPGARSVAGLEGRDASPVMPMAEGSVILLPPADTPLGRGWLSVPVDRVSAGGSVRVRGSTRLGSGSCPG